MPDLTILGALKNRLKIPASNAGADDELAALIAQTSADFCNACNRDSFFTTEYVERRDGQGGQVMVLRQTPVVSVRRLSINGVDIPASADGVQSGYVFDRVGVKLAGAGFTFARGFGNVLIEYAAGFGESVQDPAFPAEISLAVLDWCEYRHRVRPAAGMAAKHLHTGETVTYDHRTMPETTRRVIEQYKRRVAVV